MSNRPAIVIPKGPCNVPWRGNHRTLKPLPVDKDSNHGVFLCGVRVEPGDNNVWFRITSEAARRMQENTSELRGARLVECLIVWYNESRDHQLGSFREFQVYVSDAGVTSIEPYGD